MERDFHNDDFERLLREKSNEFRMYPTKRVWNSIYNNVHPGRKWPSVAMSITLITSLLLVGYLNTRIANNRINSTFSEPQQNVIAQTISPKITSPFLIFNTGHQSDVTKALENIETSTVPNSTQKSGLNNNNNQMVVNLSPVPEIKSNSNLQTSKNDVLGFNESNSTNNNTANTQIVRSPAGNNSLPELANEQVDELENIQTVIDGDETAVLTFSDKAPISQLTEGIPPNGLTNKAIEDKLTLLLQGVNYTLEETIFSVNKNEFINTEDKNWIENYALYNKPATKKWANKLATQFYATPSVVYRSLENHPDFSNTITATPFAISTSTQDLYNAVNHEPGVGIEIGTGLQYSIFKSVKLKAGLQFNFTRYNSDAFLNSHPVTTLLTMHDFKTNTSYQVSRATPYSNKKGLESVKLHNETFQISLPIGMDIKLIGNGNLQWNVGATIQPTYVVGGKSYLISTDRLNYVKETSMLNQWNLNAGFETNITYKAKGLTYQIGPQFRTQVYSTNSKNYAVEERLVNYGLKFGVSKIIK